MKDHHFQLQDIKFDAITEEQIDQMYQFTNCYEALFSKRAIKYKSMGLKDQNLKEEDFKNLILEEYTFLKRPVFIVGQSCGFLIYSINIYLIKKEGKNKKNDPSKIMKMN